MGDFLKRYSFSLLALLIALIVLFFVMNQLGKRVPGAGGAVFEKAGALASGQAYTFSG